MFITETNLLAAERAAARLDNLAWIAYQKGQLQRAADLWRRKTVLETEAEAARSRKSDGLAY
mgnify:CR=1 FL=1